MGWNTSALFVRDRSVDDVAGLLPDVLGYEPTGERAGAEAATSAFPPGRLYLAETGGWCQLWDSSQLVPFKLGEIVEADPGALKGTRALAVAFASVSSMYALWLYDDAELVRHVFFENGTPVVDVGAPLPVESRLEIPSWGPDEDFLWGVIEAETGLTFDLDASFAVYESDFV